MLVALAGPPGTGKSTIAARLAIELDATLLAVDDVEASLLVAGIDGAQPTGLAAYVVADRLARIQLRGGRSVVVDAVNDAEEARQQWRDVAASTGAPLRWLEVRLDDPAAHRTRLETRTRDLPGDFPEPPWASVEQRRGAFAGWREPRVVLDAAEPLERVVATALRALGR